MSDIHIDKREVLNEAAFAHIYSRYKNMVRQVIMDYENDADEVDDLIQTIFTAMWESRESYRGESQLSTWLTGIARNVCARHVRDNMRQPSLIPASGFGDNVDECSESWLEQRSVEYDNPESILIAQECAEGMNGVLDTLVGRELEVYRLHWDEAMTPKEIAARTSTCESTVRVVIHHIKQKLLKSR